MGEEVKTGPLFSTCSIKRNSQNKLTLNHPGAICVNSSKKLKLFFEARTNLGNVLPKFLNEEWLSIF